MSPKTITHEQDIKQIKNLQLLPYIEKEGTFFKLLPRPPVLAPSDKYSLLTQLKPHDRIFFHQTLSSARRFAAFKPNYHKIPCDSLDFILHSQYNPITDCFADKVDVVLQSETIGQPTFRRLRNTRDVDAAKIIAIGHPLIIGGCTERMATSSVKLICVGPHTPITNPGYSRQNGDGNYFNY